jgi:acetyl esterase/lipase
MRSSIFLITTAIVAIATLAACSPLGLLNATTPSGGYRRDADIAYGRLARQKLDVYVPDRARGPLPVVVFFYGGAWQEGRRDQYRFAGEALASRGLLAVVPDYRVYPEVRYPEFLRDGAAVVRWVRDHAGDYGGDPSRLVVMGHSAGAYNAAMLALDGRWLAEVGLDPKTALRGWIGLSGPYDFLPIRTPVIQVIFGPRESWPETQPVAYVSAGAPPAMLVTGDADTRVRPGNTDRLAARLRDVGVPVTVLTYPGVGHGRTVAALARPLRGDPPILEEIGRFVLSR